MIIDSDFSPPPWLENPHAQTLLANLIHPPTPQVSREILELDDGDELELAHGTAQGSDRVLILHGLEGSLRSPYAARIVNALNAAGIPVSFLFYRGCNGRPNRLARSYHSGETGDLRQVIAHLKRQGAKRLALIGYSLGGNVTLKYLGEAPPDTAIHCAAAVSTPLLLDICARRMQQGFSRIYQKELLARLKRKLAAKRQLLRQQGFDIELAALRSFVDFDDAYTAPVHGFDKAERYYRICSARQYLHAIDRPTLILQARDDPFMTPAVLPAEDELSPAIRFELADRGGHVGFIGGRGPLRLRPYFWLEPKLVDWLREQNFGQRTDSCRKPEITAYSSNPLQDETNTTRRMT